MNESNSKWTWDNIVKWILYGFFGFLIFRWLQLTWFPENRDISALIWLMRFLYWIIIWVLYETIKERDKEIEKLKEQLEYLQTEYLKLQCPDFLKKKA